MANKPYYEIKVKDDKQNIIFHSVIYAFDDIEALALLYQKFSAIFIAGGLNEGEQIIINKRSDEE